MDEEMASSQNTNNLDSTDNLFPSIYVNEDILKRFRGTDKNFTANNKTYKINNEIFVEEDRISREEYVEFEFHAKENKDAFCSTSDNNILDSDAESDLDNDDRVFNITVQRALKGYIINSNMYITKDEWNTLMFHSTEEVYCAVCDIYCNSALQSEHIKAEFHLKNLKRHPPINRFDLCIVRKIKDKYHCGVCNELIDIANSETHFDSKIHEDNMLFAINKVSDMPYDDDLYDDESDDDNEKNDKNVYHFNRNAINSVENYVDYVNVIDDNDENVFDYGFYSNATDEIDEHNESDGDAFISHTGPSYACVAQKPKIEIPKFVTVNLAHRKVRVQFNSWHMIIKPKGKKAYCMACKEYILHSSVGSHCISNNHTNVLKKFTVVEKYTEYFIRKLDNDRLYHCAHCNNLQLIHNMDYHLELMHPRKNKSIHNNETLEQPMNRDDDTNNNNNDNNDKAINDDVSSKNNSINENRRIIGDNDNLFDGYVSNNIINQPVNNFGDIVICPLGFEIKISFLSYHIVCQRPNDFYCGLCDWVIANDSILEHLRHPMHLNFLNSVPFILFYQHNLIRYIRGVFHCAICNTPCQPSNINAHIDSIEHLRLQSRALGFKNQEVIKVPVVNATNVNLDLKSVKINATEADRTKNIAVDAEDDYNNNNLNSLKENESNNDLNDSNEAIKGLDENNESFETTTTEDECFDSEEYIYIKLNNGYAKIGNSAYNTIVQIGDGARYCFVCSTNIDFEEIKKHIESRSHFENLEKCKFIDKYEEHLFRQMYLTYHCSVCNVILTRKQIQEHITWPTHEMLNEYTHSVIKKMRKTDVKSGIKQIIATTEKENIYLNGNEPNFEIIFNVKIVKTIDKDETINKDDGIDNSLQIKNKMIIVNDNALVIKWDSWNGLHKTGNCFKCIICQTDVEDIRQHLDDSWHVSGLEKPFESQFLPHLIRKINDAVVNCVTCNMEMSIKSNVISEHVCGKKHRTKYQQITKESNVNIYTDCSDDVLII